MICGKRGSITAFSAMLFLVFLLLVSMCVEGVYIYVGKGKAMGACMAGLSHTKGNYQKELFEQYQVFAMDARYEQKLPEDFAKKVKESLEESRDSFRFQVGKAQIGKQVYLTDQNGEVLKYQIRELMKYQMGAEVVSLWTDKFNKAADHGGDLSAIQQQIDQEEKDAQEKEKMDQIEKGEKQEDPRDGLMKMIRQGSISLVLGKRKVSGLQVPAVYGNQDDSTEQTWNFFKKSSMEEKLKEGSKTSGGKLSSELPGILYGLQYFHHLTSTEKKEGLQYEVEYLIAGKGTEKENLGTVLWKMIFLRFFTNTVYIYKDPVKGKEAAALAASILGITGIPPLVSLAKNLLLLALAYGESVIDVRNLAEGKKVPLTKSKATWQLPFTGLATLTCKRKPVQQGLDYEDYLFLLLTLQKNQREKYLRMLDVMEHNVKQKVPGLSLKKCPVSYKVTLDMTLNSLRFGGMSLPVPFQSRWKFQRITGY